MKQPQFVQVTFEELKLTKTLGADGFLLLLHLRRHICRDPKSKWKDWSWPQDALLATDCGWGRKRIRAARRWLEKCGAITLKKAPHGWRYLIHLDHVNSSLRAPESFADRLQNRFRKGLPSVVPVGKVTNDVSPTPVGKVVTYPSGESQLNREIEIEKPQEGGEEKLPPFEHLYLPHEIEDKLTIAGAEFYLASRSKGPMSKLSAEGHKREYLAILEAAKKIKPGKQKARKGKEER